MGTQEKNKNTNLPSQQQRNRNDLKSMWDANRGAVIGRVKPRVTKGCSQPLFLNAEDNSALDQVAAGTEQRCGDQPRNTTEHDRF